MKKKMILFLSITFVVVMAAVFIQDITKGDFSATWPDALGRILFSVLPVFLLFLRKIRFSLSLIIGYYLFLFCTFILGAILGFYNRFRWWDTVLHFFGSAYTAFIGIAIYNILLPNALEKGISRWMIFLFVFSFAMTINILWESAEFIGAVTGFMVEDKNKDTMTDLLTGTAGGLVVACWAGFRKRTG
ncbi:hypothetical protein [Domibacillus indicus]|uniref:hypothetical protein n=1 Tax=Domibacillus indicus TaxID=1437523 RepID=UPI00069627FC|nr:hypothetical protein [Domibacillus indicus]